MKDGNRKSNDGIKRLKKSQRTRASTRSFDVPSTKINLMSSEPEKSFNKKKRKKTIGIKKSSKKLKSPILGDYTRPEIPELKLKKSFYTAPKRVINKESYVEKIFTFISINKKIVGFIGRGVFVFILLLIVLSQSPKAYVTVESHQEYQNINASFLAHKNPKLDELGFDIIAISDEESISINTESEKRVEKKSQGEVTIFNNFSTEPQRLLPETRFESASGKIFNLGDTELLVPGKNNNEPGKINAIVFAEKPGEEYNLDITDFTIPGFKEAGLDDKYNGLYAVSNSSFDGGFIGNQPFISLEEEQKAENELREKIEQRLLLRLMKEKTDQVILVDKSSQIKYKPLEIIFSNEETSGVISQEGTIIALVVSKENLSNYLTENNIKVPQNESAQVVDIENITIQLNSVDTDTEYDKKRTALLQVNGMVNISWNINEELLSLDLSEKRKEELIPYFKTKNNIDSAKVKTRPFWKSRLPKNTDNIIISQ